MYWIDLNENLTHNNNNNNNNNTSNNVKRNFYNTSVPFVNNTNRPSHMNGFIQKYYIICSPPDWLTKMSEWQHIIQNKTFSQQLTYWTIIDKQSSNVVATHSTPKFWYFHFINCCDLNVDLSSITIAMYVICDLIIFPQSMAKVIHKLRVQTLMKNGSAFDSFNMA